MLSQVSWGNNLSLLTSWDTLCFLVVMTERSLLPCFRHSDGIGVWLVWCTWKVNLSDHWVWTNMVTVVR